MSSAAECFVWNTAAPKAPVQAKAPATPQRSAIAANALNKSSAAAAASGNGISGRRMKTGSDSIARHAATEDKRFDAKQVITKQTSAQLLSLWHSNNKPAAAKSRIRSQKSVSEELQTTNAELKLLRRARLKQLYDDEFVAQQNEMHARGLALLVED